GIPRDEVKITAGKRLTLGKDIEVPLDSDSTCLVNFPGKWEDTFRHYSYIDIIDSYVSEKFPIISHKKPVVDLSSLKGSTCFIGVTATATPDAHPSPFNSLYPGVGVNASLFNSLLTRKFVQRANRFVNILILIAVCFLTAFISKRAKTLLSFIVALIFILAYMLFTAALFIFFGLWIDVFYPVIAIALVYLGVTFFKYICEVNKIEILEKELNIAKNIQESFLPKEKPNVPGIDVAAKMITAKQVGGDLYDFILNKNGKFGMMIGDVSGKGVPAALYMAKVVSEFKTYAHNDLASEVIKKLNTQLCSESGSGLFVTLTYLIFDLNLRTASYSTGGHLPMILLKKNDPKPKLIDLAEGTPLGLFVGEFTEKTLKYEKGDMFILYTDGVTEAMNAKREMFEQNRLLDLVEKNSNAAPQEMVDIIQREVKNFEGKQSQHDDITVIAARIL
ncbi:MAG: SpoIIE family protein phosphatase, partial [Candidatus Omnitrophota bacterium]